MRNQVFRVFHPTTLSYFTRSSKQYDRSASDPLLGCSINRTGPLLVECNATSWRGTRLREHARYPLPSAQPVLAMLLAYKTAFRPRWSKFACLSAICGYTPPASSRLTHDWNSCGLFRRRSREIFISATFRAFTWKI